MSRANGPPLTPRPLAFTHESYTKNVLHSIFQVTLSSEDYGTLRPLPLPPLPPSFGRNSERRKGTNINIGRPQQPTTINNTNAITTNNNNITTNTANTNTATNTTNNMNCADYEPARRDTVDYPLTSSHSFNLCANAR